MGTDTDTLDHAILKIVKANMAEASDSYAVRAIFGILETLARRHGPAFSIALACELLEKISLKALEIRADLLEIREDLLSLRDSAS